MAVGGGFYAVGGYATGWCWLLGVLGWLARVTNLKAREMGFRITASHTEDIGKRVQKLARVFEG